MTEVKSGKLARAPIIFMLQPYLEVGMRKFIIAGCCLAPALALGGCGQDAPKQQTTKAEAPKGNYQASLQAMPEGERNAVFIRAIRDAGLPCQGVESSTLQGETYGAPTWKAHCLDSGDWYVLIGEGGIAQVANAAQLKQAKPLNPGNSQ